MTLFRSESTPHKGPGAHWKPILQGSLRDRAMDTVWALAEALFDVESDPQRGREPSLAGGNAAVALFYGYQAKVCRGHGYRELSIAFLARSLRGVISPYESPALLRGTTGVAWVATHLQEETGHGTCLPEWTDSALLQLLNRSATTQDAGLLNGLAGFGAYALERYPRPEAVRLLEEVVDRLDRSAVRSERGAAWFTPSAQVPDERWSELHHGGYDLSLTRGSAGVISLLSQMVARGVAVRRARPLLEEAVTWLLSHRLGPQAGACFPAWVRQDQAPLVTTARTCQGDVGIAAALLNAARALQNPAWEREALTVARLSAARPPAHYGVSEPSFCQGSAGLAHLFNRLYQRTGDPELQRAARFWIEQTLIMRGPGAGAPNDRGLLRGAAGVALVLLAAATPVEPAWDRLFLLSPDPDAC